MAKNLHDTLVFFAVIAVQYRCRTIDGSTNDRRKINRIIAGATRSPGKCGKFDVDGETSVEKRCAERIQKNTKESVLKERRRECKKKKRKAFMEIQRKRSAECEHEAGKTVTGSWLRVNLILNGIVRESPLKYPVNRFRSSTYPRSSCRHSLPFVSLDAPKPCRLPEFVDSDLYLPLPLVFEPCSRQNEELLNVPSSQYSNQYTFIGVPSHRANREPLKQPLSIRTRRSRISKDTRKMVISAWKSVITKIRKRVINFYSFFFYDFGCRNALSRHNF